MAKEKADKANAEAEEAKAAADEDADDEDSSPAATSDSDQSDDEDADDEDADDSEESSDSDDDSDDEDDDDSDEDDDDSDEDDDDSDEDDDDDSDEEDEDDDDISAKDDEVTKAEGPDAKKRSSDRPPSAPKHDHAHGHDDHDDHGLAHTMPVKGLLAVWAALMVFTVLTVSVTHFDLGYTLNLVIAMVIATIKAALVMLFFMHLWWDKRFNVVIFLSSFLFLALFVGLTLNDRGEYQQNIDAYDDAKAQ